MTFDGKAFGAEIVGVVKSYLAKELAPLTDRIDALEEKIKGIPAPVDLSADLASIKAAVEAIEMPVIPELPDIGKMVDEAIKAQMAVDDMEHSLEELVKLAVDAIPRPKDGQSVTLDDVTPLIASEVEKRVGELPKAKDGDNGKDGIGMAGALIDRKGNLVVTMTNGETKDLGPVVGKDGDRGDDGFSLENFDAALQEDGRTVLLTFSGKSQDFSVELGFPVMIYRGVWREQTYSHGDTVTLGGSLWHSETDDNSEKPGEGSKGWTLAAKRGRDGKDGVSKELSPPRPIRLGQQLGSE